MRHAAALLRQAIVVHRHQPAQGPPPRRQRDGQLGPRARQARPVRQLARAQRRLGAVARALLGHAAPRVAVQGRPHAARSARWPSSTSLAGTDLTDPHRPFVDDPDLPVRGVRASRCSRVPEVIDVWFDSGSMPFAQYHAPHAGTERFDEHFPADFICEALDQTRGWFYSLIAVNTLLFDQSPYRNVVCLGTDPRRARSQDVQVAGQHGRAQPGHRPLRRRRAALVLLHLEAALGRLPLLDGHDRRGGQAVPAPAVEHVRLLRPVRQRQRHGPRPGRAGTEFPDRRADRRSTAGSCPASRPRSRSCATAWTTSTRRTPAARSRRSSTRSPTGTCGARVGASGTATRPRSPTLRTCLLDDRQAARAVLPVRGRRDLRQPRRRGAERPPVRLPQPERGAPRPRARGCDGHRPRDCPARPGRPRPGEAQGAPAAPRRGRGGHRRTSARRSSGWRTSSATS